MNDLITQSVKLIEQINETHNQSTYHCAQVKATKLMLSATNININMNLTSVVQAFDKIREPYTHAIYSSIATYISNLIELYTSNIEQIIKKIATSFTEIIKKNNDSLNRILFLAIAEEIGFPIYLEIDTELQNRIIESYRANNNQCDKKEIQQIILDYYNGDYIDRVLNDIANVGVFNKERIALLKQGGDAYQVGLYGASASLFAVQIGGMIRDVYDAVCTFHKFTSKEKKEILLCFNQRCKEDSEKAMLLQIVCSQQSGIPFWCRVAQYFLDIIYSSGEKYMEEQPKRHMICHGIQTNYNTKEMNLKLIMCMDILSELAWRVKKMKEENIQIDI